jgi:hypothetical protein
MAKTRHQRGMLGDSRMGHAERVSREVIGYAREKVGHGAVGETIAAIAGLAHVV